MIKAQEDQTRGLTELIRTMMSEFRGAREAGVKAKPEEEEILVSRIGMNRNRYEPLQN